MDKIKVLYIGGCGRSGSTLLSRALGQIDGFFAVGELWNIWHRSFTENELCGCGKPFKECEFWNAVVEEAFGGFQHVDVDEIKALRHSVQSNLRLPMLTFRFLQPSKYQKGIESYLSVLNKLYWAIQKVSGSRVIVDSSKGPRYAYMLNQVPDIDLHIVHLVRDSRAVAYSWQKKKVKLEVYWKTAYMDSPSPIRSAINWNAVNSLFPAFKGTKVNYIRLPYEVLINNPRTWLSQIIEYLGESGANLPFSQSDSAVHLGIDHTAVGNPNRFQHGTVELCLDTEWQQKMGKGHKYLVTALTWPLLYGYGYLGGNHSSKVEGRQ